MLEQTNPEKHNPRKVVKFQDKARTKSQICVRLGIGSHVLQNLIKENMDELTAIGYKHTNKYLSPKQILKLDEIYGGLTD